MTSHAEYRRFPVLIRIQGCPGRNSSLDGPGLLAEVTSTSGTIAWFQAGEVWSDGTREIRHHDDGGGSLISGAADSES